MPIREEAVYEALRQVYDPELLVNIVDLGLVYEVAVTEQGGKTDIAVKMTMTSPACPAAPELIEDVKDVVTAMDEQISRVDVEVVMDPPWSPDRMTDEARDQLGMF